MATKSAPSPITAETLARRERRRWLEDRALEAGIPNLRQLARAAGMTSNKLTLCLDTPEKAHLDEVMGLARALGLHWYNDLVARWGFGKIRINLDEAAQLASEEGMVFGLLVNDAA